MVVGSCFLARRQDDRESRAVTELCFKLDRTTNETNNLRCSDQAHPYSMRLRAEKGMEQSLLDLCGNARSRIFHLKDNRLCPSPLESVFGSSSAQGDRAFCPDGLC